MLLLLTYQKLYMGVAFTVTKNNILKRIICQSYCSLIRYVYTCCWLCVLSCNEGAYELLSKFPSAEAAIATTEPVKTSTSSVGPSPQIVR